MTKTVGLIFSCLLLHLQGAVLEIRHPLYKLANISYTGILSGDLGVHIGVYQLQSITPF